MALAVAQSKQITSDTNYVNSLSAAFTANVTAGSTLVLFASSSSNSIDVVSVTDSNGNTWAKILSKASNTRSADMWYCKNANAGATTVYLSAGSSYDQREMILLEVTGADTLAPIEASAFTAESGYNDTHTQSVSNLSQPALMIMGFAGTSGSGSYTSAGNTLIGSTGGDGAPAVVAYKGVSSIASQTISITAGGTAYEEGVTMAIIVKQTSVYVPRDTPPAATNTPNWHKYGALPNKTVAAMRTATIAFWNNQIKPYIVTTGMPSGMPTGAMRVKRPENSNDTVSEGMGYGLIAAVYCGNSNISGYDPDGKMYFDNMWKYVKFFLNTHGLMAFHIDTNGTVLDSGAATDADYDIAWALHMAHKTWGSTGAVNYAAERDAMLSAILAYETYSASHATTALRNVMINGDLFDTGFTGSPDIFDPDYFAPAYFTEWATLNTRWASVKSANQAIYSATDNYKTGMIPDHQKRDGSPSTVSGLTGYNNTYNAVRRFRQVLDYLWNGSTLPEPYKDYWQHADLAAFMQTYSGGTLSQLHGEFNLQGTQNAGYTNGTFKASYMVAMLVNNSSSTLAGAIFDNITSTPDGSYFGDTVIMMSLLTASGLFVANPPAVASTTGRKKVKLAGAFVQKPVKVKIGGTFVAKVTKKKVGGSFSQTL